MQAGALTGAWSVAAGALLVAAIAVFADWRRTRRRDADRVGWVPWPLVLMAAVLIAALAIRLALEP